MRKWWRRCKRRRGGIYLWRTRKHAAPWKRENAYVGETTSFTRRAREHSGTGMYGTAAKPWFDLDPICYRVIPLPWWLCWKWVRLPLETLVILVTWPRYNVKKNRWNPRRIPIYLAKRQRAARDAAGITGRAARGGRLVQVLGVLIIVIGLVGAYVTGKG